MKEIIIHRKNFKTFFPQANITFNAILKRSYNSKVEGRIVNSSSLGDNSYYLVRVFTLDEIIQISTSVLDKIEDCQRNKKFYCNWQEFIDLCKEKEKEIKKEGIDNG